MGECADEEGDDCGYGSRHHGEGGAVDMSPEEMMDWNVPFAGEFELKELVSAVRRAKWSKHTQSQEFHQSE